MQSTSLQAYASIVPTLGNRCATVLQAILDLGPCTQKDVKNHLGWEINKVTGRFTNLKDLGIIRDSGRKKMCEGREAIVWELVPKKGEQLPIFF